MRRTYSVYIEEKVLQELFERYLGEVPERIGSKELRKLLESISEAGTLPENPEKTLTNLTRLTHLYEFRKKIGKTKAKDLDAFLGEVLDYLREDIFFKTPKNL